MKKIILFDLDGTLIDSTEAILDSFSYSFEKEQFQFQGTQDDIKDLIGYPLDYMFSNLGVEENRVWDFVTTYKESYKKISKQKTTLLEGAYEAILEASKIGTLGIVTTKTGSYSKELLEHMDVMKYFQTLVGRENVENPKPHPEPINVALKNLGINNKEAYEIWMIGDTKLDLISAKEANVHSLGVLCGYSTKSELQKYTSNIFENSLEAINYLKNKVM